MPIKQVRELNSEKLGKLFKITQLNGVKFKLRSFWPKKVKAAQSCLTVSNPMDYTVHEILQAGILEWVAFPFSGASSQPRDRSQVSHIASGFFTSQATKEAQEHWSGYPIPSPGDLPKPGIELWSPELQADSLPAEPQRKPKNTGVGSLSLLRRSSPPRNQTGIFCIAGRFFTNWAIREAHLKVRWTMLQCVENKWEG